MNSYIGLGSNLGERVLALRAAVSELESRGVGPLRCSGLYDTEPVDAPGDAWFVNAVVEVDFDGDPVELLGICRSIERAHGREGERTTRNAPRTLDLDILLVGDRIIDTSDLIVPHPRIHLRRFVLEPMVELVPDLEHPVLKKTMRALLDACPDRSDVRRREGVFAS